VKYRKGWICAGLVLCCIAIYGQTLCHAFGVYDDQLYVTENAEVRGGLTWAGVVWAFTTDRAMYMHPITWMSHMLDCDLYGMRPWGHHLTSVVFHTLNSVLLFLVLARMTRMTWPSALAAALWAVNPLRVESVAWVAERKDVLSMFFWTLGMGAYAWHREKPGPARYMLVPATFILGFLSKPMMVTFPCALLLLDYWPLARVDRTAPAGAMSRQAARLALEKTPLILLTAAMSAVTMVMQMRGDNLAFMGKVPLADRCANAVVVYAIYIQKTLWPSDLAVYYPHPIHRPLWQVAMAAVVLAAVTAVCVREIRRRPHLIVGWLWYLGTLVPVIELVQAGSFSHADRYTYIPSIGLFIMFAFSLDELRQSRRFPQRAATAIVLLLVCAYTAVAVHQTAYWKDAVTLFRHALDVTPDNSVSRNNLGSGLFEKNLFEESIKECTRAVELDPTNSAAIENVAMSLHMQGKYEEALIKHREALAALPGNEKAMRNIKVTLRKLGKLDAQEKEFEALVQKVPKSVDDRCRMGALAMALGDPAAAFQAFNEALQLEPDSKRVFLAIGDVLESEGKYAAALDYYEKAHRTAPKDAQILYNIGVMQSRLNRPADATKTYREAIQCDPGFAMAQNNLASLLYNAGDVEASVDAFRKAIALEPKYIQPRINLARILGAQGKTGEAIQLCGQAVEIDPASVPARLRMADLLLEAGRSAEAKAHAEKALELAPGNPEAEALMRRIPTDQPAAASGDAPRQ